MQEQYKLVRHFLEQSLAIDEELQDKNGMAANLEILTDVTLSEGDYGAAEQYLERAVHILTEQGKQKQASTMLFNAGKRIYGQLQEQASPGEGKEAKGETEDKGKKAEKSMMNTVSERVKDFLREALDAQEVRIIGIDTSDESWIAETEVVERDLTLPGYHAFEKKHYIVRLNSELEISSYRQLKNSNSSDDSEIGRG